ncbi:hypothetical protein [Kordia jejudonensis]|uniref:hypothetical protein n=1 Tax=Kordia jejudonensis TaxID=1348245 RepID=UPI0006299A04|nr:hypothetical protein [Kordia jejudonensis]
MEDFDYIDALAKSELSGREATPSSNGWDIVQGKLAQKRKKRRLLYLLLFFVLISSVGIYQGINFNESSNDNSITNTNTEQQKSGNTENTNSTSTSTSNSDSDSNSDSTTLSQAEKNAVSTHDTLQTKTKNQSGNKVRGSGNGVVETASKAQSRGSDTKNNTIYSSQQNIQSTAVENATKASKTIGNEEIIAEAEDLQIYNWTLISPETLKKKRKKTNKQTSKKASPIYKNTDIMVGLNGFFTPNDYQIITSYVVELSYEFKNELKKDYAFNYGVGLQLRNLHFKKDSIRFNKGELSFNLFSNLEKRFGDYSVEAGVYAGYEIYSPNNEFFNDKVKSFFDQKINYGLSTGINYKNIGLIFKYELSPYVNYLGDKKYGGFILGVKYDF